MCDCATANKCLDVRTPRNVHLSAFFRRSFAFHTVKNRMPVILSNLVDSLVRNKAKIAKHHGLKAAEELKIVIGELSELRYEIQTNKPLKLLTSKAPDAQVYNQYIMEQAYEKGFPTHFHTIWLLAECYMYRRIRQTFEKTEFLKEYDPFAPNKEESYLSSLPLIRKMGKYLMEMLNIPPLPKVKHFPETEEPEFTVQLHNEYQSELIATMDPVSCRQSEELGLGVDTSTTLKSKQSVVSNSQSTDKYENGEASDRRFTLGSSRIVSMCSADLDADLESESKLEDEGDAKESLTSKDSKHSQKSSTKKGMEASEKKVEYSLVPQTSSIYSDSVKVYLRSVSDTEARRESVRESRLRYRSSAVLVKNSKEADFPNLLSESETETESEPSIDPNKEEFISLLKLNLWGNKCDLSISLGKIAQHTTLFDTDALDSHILTDHSDLIWDAIADPNASSREVIIIFDNVGYEVFTDLSLADYMVTTGLADKVHLYVKTIPWFISDVMTHDLLWMLKHMKKTCDKYLGALADRWMDYIENGIWVVEETDFWTLPFDYTYMKKVDPELYKKLGKAKLAVFKGDLNYRKLFGEKNWDPVISVEEGLQDFHPTKLAILRTIKADIVCGLEKGVAEKIEEQDPKWMEKGDWGVIQFCGKVVPLLEEDLKPLTKNPPDTDRKLENAPKKNSLHPSEPGKSRSKQSKVFINLESTTAI